MIMVTGYVPHDTADVYCVPCAERIFPDADLENDEVMEGIWAFGAIFNSSETDYVQTCDACGGEIETVVLQEDDDITWYCWQCEREYRTGEKCLVHMDEV